jgi:hypothetical protein
MKSGVGCTLGERKSGSFLIIASLYLAFPLSFIIIAMIGEAIYGDSPKPALMWVYFSRTFAAYTFLVLYSSFLRFYLLKTPSHGLNLYASFIIVMFVDIALSFYQLINNRNTFGIYYTFSLMWFTALWIRLFTYWILHKEILKYTKG